MDQRKTTLQDVAAYCQVSAATVSRVINGTGRISSETRDRIKSAIDSLGYIPNASAKSLKTGTTRLVGIFVTDLEYEISMSAVTRLQDCLLEKGYDSIICNVGVNAEREEYYYNLMVSLNVCGIMVLSLRTTSSLYKISKLPVVCIYRNPLIEGDSDHVVLIETDDFGAGKTAGDELIRLGCRKVAEARLASLDSRVPLGRHLGLLQSLYEHNLPFDESLCILSQGNSYKAIYQAIGAALDTGRIADGYFCSSDVIAAALLRALETRNIAVPQRVKVIGCNDMNIAQYSRGITTIRHQLPAMCEEAARVMDKMLSGQTLNPDEKHRIFPVSLIRRDTT